MKRLMVTKKSSMEHEVVYWISASPVGRLLLVASPKGLQALQFQDGARPLDIHPTWKKAREPFRAVLVQLREYFGGFRTQFQVKLDLHGTPFQRQVWQALQRIPYGRRVSYGEIAKQVGRPKASRPVGAANGQNPVSIIVPCHRVIGANGQLVGYGGGLPIKTALLELEQSRP
jgi:methylated-DNA-[protein]-cysteine S-methyltransferase